MMAVAAPEDIGLLRALTNVVLSPSVRWVKQFVLFLTQENLLLLLSSCGQETDWPVLTFSRLIHVLCL
jgi:hypothetical protein